MQLNPAQLDQIRRHQASLPRERAAMPKATVAAELDQRRAFLSADSQRPTPLEAEALLGVNDLLEISFVDRIQLVSRAVCRLVVKLGRQTEFASGFLVGQGLLLTNHHVLPDADTAAQGMAEFDYRYDVSGELRPARRFALRPDLLFINDEALDFALCAVAERSVDGAHAIAGIGHLRLIEASGKVRKNDFVTVVQHPDGQPMQIALRENEVIDTREGEPVIWYRADTAHGSSGSPVFNDTLQVAALHRSGLVARDAQGRYKLKRGGVVKSLDGLNESDVVWEANVGTRVSSICAALRAVAAAQAPLRARLTALFEPDDVLASAVLAARAVPPDPSAQDIATNPAKPASTPAELNLTIGNAASIPLTLRISLEGVGGVAAPARAAGTLQAESFAMQIPVIHDGLDARAGFDPKFLALPQNRRLAMPALTASGKKVAAPLLHGTGHELRYHHFSIVMHKERRLPLITSCNVDWRPQARPLNPKTGKGYTRGQLSGIPENVAEQWVTDPRVAPAHQLPDIFYTRDGGAFDKGHVVRRDDMCWGGSFEDVQMANGDTYHVTNCTPQLATLNQSAKGSDNWGDFENEVQKVTRAQRVCIFAGPVLAADDRWFRGRDDSGPLRIQVPQRFWKIVVANEAGRATAWGFMFAQDVSAITEKELAFDARWRVLRHTVKEIALLTRGWLDLSALQAIDQPV